MTDHRSEDLCGSLDRLHREFHAHDYKTGRVNVDARTWYDVRMETQFDINLASNGEIMWRDMPVTIRRAEIPMIASVTEIDPLATVSLWDEFCMYIEAEKRNGRKVYLDHPRTAPEFL